jgi:hypothetical protein
MPEMFYYLIVIMVIVFALDLKIEQAKSPVKGIDCDVQINLYLWYNNNMKKDTNSGLKKCNFLKRLH